MRVIVIALLISMLTMPIAYAETLSGLLERLQWRIGEPDTAQAFLPDTALQLFLNDAQNKVVRLNGYLPKQVDITFDFDSMKYALPSDFKLVEGVLARMDDNRWYKVSVNPYFMIEGDSLQYFIGWKTPDSAELYFKGKDFYNGMVIRVFYRARAPSMDSLPDSCYVPTDLHGEIIEEAASYYEHANHNYGAFQLLNQGVRMDLGILKQGVQK